jgi:hypothetical protein
MRFRSSLPEEESDSSDSVPFLLNVNRNKDGVRSLSCAELLNLNPLKSGYCEKKSSSVYAYFFPCWFPLWKTRFLVLIGSFLYRFGSIDSDNIKGVPIPLCSANVEFVGDCTFRISLIRKEYIFKVHSDQEAQQWGRSNQQSKIACYKGNDGSCCAFASNYAHKCVE